MIARPDAGDAGADFGCDPRSLVAGNERRPDSAPEGSVHHQQVVVAEAAGLDLDENVEVAEGGRRQVRDGEAGEGRLAL